MSVIYVSITYTSVCLYYEAHHHLCTTEPTDKDFVDRSKELQGQAMITPSQFFQKHSRTFQSSTYI